jgi:hypothetical protein
MAFWTVLLIAVAFVTPVRQSTDGLYFRLSEAVAFVVQNEYRLNTERLALELVRRPAELLWIDPTAEGGSRAVREMRRELSRRREDGDRSAWWVLGDGRAASWFFVATPESGLSGELPLAEQLAEVWATSDGHPLNQLTASVCDSPFERGEASQVVQLREPVMVETESGTMVRVMHACMTTQMMSGTGPDCGELRITYVAQPWYGLYKLDEAGVLYSVNVPLRLFEDLALPTYSTVSCAATEGEEAVTNTYYYASREDDWDGEALRPDIRPAYVGVMTDELLALMDAPDSALIRTALALDETFASLRWDAERALSAVGE